MIKIVPVETSTWELWNTKQSCKRRDCQVRFLRRNISHYDVAPVVHFCVKIVSQGLMKEMIRITVFLDLTPCSFVELRTCRCLVTRMQGKIMT
jgi:hypothetical protein